jgi:hypothetical protein
MLNAMATPSDCCVGGDRSAAELLRPATPRAPRHTAVWMFVWFEGARAVRRLRQEAAARAIDQAEWPE